MPGSNIRRGGKVISIDKDVVGFHRDQVSRHGQPSMLGLGFQKGVMITHPDHLQQVLLDKNQDFSSRMGYEKAVARYYRGAFIMQDFGEHKLSRGIMQACRESVKSRRSSLESSVPLCSLWRGCR